MTLSSSIQTQFFADDGTVPNNRLPLVLYRGALGGEGDLATRCEDMFEANGWPGAWRNGIYGHHHYHSTAHEVLGIARGSARVRLGRDHGATVELRGGGGARQIRDERGACGLARDRPSHGPRGSADRLLAAGRFAITRRATATELVPCPSSAPCRSSSRTRPGAISPGRSTTASRR